MKKNELTVGADYAVRMGRGRHQHMTRMTYVGDSPWFTGSGEANLTTIRYDDPNLSVDGDGVRRYKREGYMSVTILPSNRILSHAGVDYLVQPGISGWRSSAFKNHGKGRRGLFVWEPKHGDSRVRFELAAYGDKIVSTWADYEEQVLADRERQKKYEAARKVEDQYLLAIVREAIEVLDGIGADCSLATTVKKERDELIKEMDAEREPFWLHTNRHPALILLGTGKYDPFDLMLTNKREEA